jgi:hypothetical protein
LTQRRHRRKAHLETLNESGSTASRRTCVHSSLPICVNASRRLGDEREAICPLATVETLDFGWPPVRAATAGALGLLLLGPDRPIPCGCVLQLDPAGRRGSGWEQRSVFRRKEKYTHPSPADYAWHTQPRARTSSLSLCHTPVNPFMCELHEPNHTRYTTNHTRSRHLPANAKPTELRTGHGAASSKLAFR